MITKVIVAMLPAVALGAQDTCRALVLSGGGSNGSWEAGVIWGLYHYGNVEDFAYDVITGVSAGAINSVAMAGWEPLQGKEMSEYISYTWQHLTNSDIWVEWPGPMGIVQGVSVRPGLLNNGPLFEFLREQISSFPEGYKRRVTIAAVNVETGEYTTFDQTNTAFFDLPHAAVSSASIPFAFPPHVWEGRGIFMDGGTVWNVNVDSAVQQCLEVVDDPSKIIVDIIVCGSPPQPESKWDAEHDALSNFMLNRNIHSYYSNSDTIKSQKIANPDVNFRYLFNQVNESLSGKKELTFNNETTWPLQEDGRNVAFATLNAGEGALFQHLDDYLSTPELKTQYKSWGVYAKSILNL